MDESAIASSLAEKLKSAPSPAEQPSTPTVSSRPEPEPVDAAKPLKEDPLAMYRLLDFFDVPQIDREDLKIQEQLGIIYEWGREQAGNGDQLAAMEKIRELQQRLGLTFRNDEKLTSLYRWIRLDNERRRIEREMTLAAPNGGL